MNTTRLHVDLRHWNLDKPGDIRNVDGLLNLLYNFNETMGAGATQNNARSSKQSKRSKDSTPSVVDSGTENLPQNGNTRVKKGKRRAESVSPADEPAPKRRKSNEKTSQDQDDSFRIWHRIEIQYTDSFPDEQRPPHFRRLLNALEQAWSYFPNLPTGPLYMYTQKGNTTSPIICLMEPLSPGGKLPRNQGFTNLPLVGDVSSLMRDYDFTMRHCNLLRALLDLQNAGRAEIDMTLTVHPPVDIDPSNPSSSLDNSGPLFVISISISAKFINIDIPAEITSSTLEAQRRVLLELFPQDPSTQFKTPTITDFITGLQPAPELSHTVSYASIQPPELRCQLLPFQARTVFWMLNREGFTISKKGKVVPQTHVDEILQFWEQVSTPAGSTRYLNRLTGEIMKLDDIGTFEPVRGGILAEEVGCGKTVESIALILLNKPQKRGPWNTHWNDIAEIPLYEVKTTLIVTPTSLQKQWIEEMRKHAPTLKVCVYDGWKSVNKKNSNVTTEYAEYFQGFDVVITTYHVLSSELSVAKGAISRPRRQAVEYGERSLPKSPLVSVEFWRVLMDEVQLSGGINIVDMVSRIPRVNSFAVSGTPARSSVADLAFVLRFLRVPDIIVSSKVWKRLCAPAFFENFISLFDTRLAVRTSKSQVTNEFQLPRQTRYIVPIEFGKIERTIYDDILETALQQLQVDGRGVATRSGWEMDLASLRSWLHRLRQTCTHPQVGGAGKVDKVIGGRGIKSMEEVLEAIRLNTEDQIIVERRRKGDLKIRHSQLLLAQPERTEDCLLDVEVLQLSALSGAQDLLRDVDSTIKAHNQVGKQLMEEAVEKKRQRKLASAHENALPKPKGVKGKGRLDETDSDSEDSGNSDIEDDGAPDLDSEIPKKSKQWKWWIKTEKGKEWRFRQQFLVTRRRDILIMLHRVQLLLGDTYFNLENPEKEKSFYDQAEKTRELLLGASEKAAVKSMELLPKELAKIASKSNEPVPTEPPTVENLLIDGPPAPGIETESIFIDLDEIVEVLNEQTQILFEWKDHIVELLTAQLIEDAEAGDAKTPYEKALEVQSECEAYLKAYQSLLADRREALIAERTILAVAEQRQDKTRTTQASKQAAALEVVDTTTADSEKEILDGLDQRRRNLLKSLSGRAVRTIVNQLTGVIDSTEIEEERALAQMESLRLKRLITRQTKQMDRLDKQLAPIRKTFNDRIEYFRQLQALNDSVASAEWEEKTLFEAIENCKRDYEAAEAIVAARLARQRYLNSIGNPGNEEDEEDQRTCILCKCEFDKGVILGCIHHFCEECIMLWMAKGTNKFCPVCRAPIDKSAIQRIHFGNHVAPDPLTEKDGLQKRREEALANYNVMPEDIRGEILDIDVVSENHGTKIMFLVKHLLWLRAKDPGSKAIVFSTWVAGLSIIANALSQNEIEYISIDSVGRKGNSVRKFEEDPDIQVLLLHGERDVSGLNITCACRCIIIEPTVNHNFEVQAIARIDRMGQTRETEVYCYSVEDTVERNILDLGARQGLSLYTKENAEIAMDVTKLQRGKEKVDAPARSRKVGDFIASGEDMLAIMFPHLYEGFQEEEDFDVVAETAVLDDALPIELDGEHSWGDAPQGVSSSTQ
ncbi:hypothetical protein CPB86DRAFT_825898 [Serendipita vermifera]|nr:hypothetical protein CPB86DRAFT_825898 [Serendipita vermifera]